VANVSAAPPFRFSRMGPKGTGRQRGEPNLRKLGELMASHSMIRASYNWNKIFDAGSGTLDFPRRPPPPAAPPRAACRGGSGPSPRG
jgi:hypothetical protein